MRRVNAVVLTFSLLLVSCGKAPSETPAPIAAQSTEQVEPQKQSTETLESKIPAVVPVNQQPAILSEKKPKPDFSPIKIKAPKSVDESQVVTLSAKVKGIEDTRGLWRRWYQLPGRGPKIYIDSPRADTISFIAPSVEKSTEVTLIFEAHEYSIGSLSKTINIMVNNVPQLPEVFAGEDVEIVEKQALTLYGFGQDINGKAVDFKWMIEPPGLFNIVLEDTKQPDARLIAPAIAVQQNVTLRLTVTDEHGRSASDHINVTIVPEEMPDSTIFDVVFEDSKLAQCIAEHSEKFGHYFAKEVRRLNCSGKNIKTLIGLEYFYNLVWLNLSDNKISNIDMLIQLPNMMFLKLDNNSIKDISPLKYSRRLSAIGLSHNKIESIADLTDMPWLRQLTLSYNNIKNNSPLLGLAPKKELIRLYYDNLDCQTVQTLHRTTQIKVMLREDCEQTEP